MALTKNDLVKALAKENGYPVNQTIEIVETMLETIKSKLASGEDVLISGFGKFCVKHKKERKGRNPATGEGHQASQGQAKFKGLTDLAGNIFDLPSESKADQFVTTTKALANHVGTIYRKNTAAFRTAVTDLVLAPPTRPADIEAGATHMPL